MGNKQIRVLLLEGFARQSMAMMEALHNAGYHVTTYNSRKTDLGYLSRFPDQKLLGYWDRTNEKESAHALLELLKQQHFDVTIPMTDFSATMLSRRKTAFNQYTKAAVNDWNIFQMAADKQNTMNACMDNGIPCPVTLRNADSIEDVLNSGLQYPLILKPRVGYGSIGLHKICNKEELRKTFDASVKAYGPMLVQEYIPQTDSQ